MTADLLVQFSAALAEARKDSAVERLRAVRDAFAAITRRALAAPTGENMTAVAEAVSLIDRDRDDANENAIVVWCDGPLNHFARQLGDKMPGWLQKYRADRKATGARRLDELRRAGWVQLDEEEHTAAPTPRMEALIRQVVRSAGQELATPATWAQLVEEIRAEVVRQSPELSEDTAAKCLRSWIQSFLGDELWPSTDDGSGSGRARA